MRIHLVESGTMKLFKVKWFVMVKYWWSLETGDDCTINRIYETLDSTGLELRSEIFTFDIVYNIYIYIYKDNDRGEQIRGRRYAWFGV